MMAYSKSIYLKLFLIIFTISSLLFIILAETFWFPIKFHHTDIFVAYISNRKVPFDKFNIAFKHIHAFYLFVFFFMTFVHVLLYHYLCGEKKGRDRVKNMILLYVLIMFFTSFVLTVLNEWYWYTSDYSTWFFQKAFINYLEILLSEWRVIILYVIVLTITTMVINYRYKRDEHFNNK